MTHLVMQRLVLPILNCHLTVVAYLWKEDLGNLPLSESACLSMKRKINADIQITIYTESLFV